jgi:hypothetical protein
MDYAAIAKKFGGQAVQDSQPQINKTPNWMQNLSQKDQAELQMKMHDEARKRIAALDESISSGGYTLDMLKRYGELNRKARTGGIHEKILPNWRGYRGNEEQEMISIQSLLAPKMRETGSGATSDRDVSMFLSALPSIELPGNVNKNIRTNFENQFNKAVRKKTVMENYLNEKGNLTGFDDYWANMNKPKQDKPAGKSKMMSPKFLGFEE